jgi:hypothetical protein
MSSRSRVLLAICCALTATALTVALVAALGSRLWQEDGVEVCTATGPQTDPALASDASGGAVMAWEDERDGLADIYAQRLDAGGNPVWQTDGITVCAAAEDQVDPWVGAVPGGGLVVAWEDKRSGIGDIYMQRLYSNGVTAWPTDGIAVCTAPNEQANPRFVSAQAFSVIAVWEDKRFLGGNMTDIYAQRVTAAGNTPWITDGVSVCADSEWQYFPRLVPDGAGGAIVAWQDFRNHETNNQDYDIYAQRVDPNGTMAWTIDGISVCTAVGRQERMEMTSDGAGGAILTWADKRAGSSNQDIYAQRLDGAGNTLWPDDGVTVCAAADNQNYPSLIPDGDQGAIIAWHDYRGPESDIYAQRVYSNGVTAWNTDGVTICAAADIQTYAKIARDGSDHAIIVWKDERHSAAKRYGLLYAQRVDLAGNLLWEADGIPVCNVPYDQEDHRIVPSSLGGAVLAWEDERPGILLYDIYAQRVGDVEPIFLPTVLKNHQ